MFFHNFKYAFKTLFKNKMLLFWTFAFPLILGTFFYMAFRDIEKSETLDIINIAIVDENISPTFKKAIDSLSNENNSEQLFNTQYVSLTEAENMLENEEITGYFLNEKNPKIVVKENGIYETIFKYVIEEIIETEKIVENVVTNEIKNNNVDEKMLSLILENVNQKLTENNVNIKDISPNHLSYTMIEYYTLIAMTCLYGGIFGLVAVNQNLANMSFVGKRMSVSPTSKSKLLISSLLASYLLQIIGIFLLFLYTIFVLKVDYGNHFVFVCLLTLAGCLAGLSLSIAVSSFVKASENTKTGLLISITMLGCFLSGMMGITMKYIVDTNIPIVNKLNPASMITDGFYSLYYYGVDHRYYFNFISLLLFSLLFILLSIFSLRRQRYDSI